MELDDEVQEIDPPIIVWLDVKNISGGYSKISLMFAFFDEAKESTMMWITPKT
jgi:hypothetical protein